MDGRRVLLKQSTNQSSFETFIDTMEQAPWIAKNFLANGRPLFNEAAYKILVNQGHQAAPTASSTTSPSGRSA